MRILRVQGRKSGHLYDIPVRIANMDGASYVLSMLGETQWVHNLRALGVAQMLVGQTAEPVRAYEIQGDEKTAFLTWYCLHPKMMGRARSVFKVDPLNLTPAEIDRVALAHPVFRWEPIQVTDA